MADTCVKREYLVNGHLLVDYAFMCMILVTVYVTYWLLSIIYNVYLFYKDENTPKHDELACTLCEPKLNGESESDEELDESELDESEPQLAPISKTPLNNTRLFKTLCLLKDLDGIRKIPQVSQIAKKSNITMLFNSFIDDSDTEELIIWLLQYTDINCDQVWIDKSLWKLFIEHATPDKLVNIDMLKYYPYEFLIIAIKRQLVGLLGDAINKMVRLKKPTCYLINSYIYKLLLDEKYFNEEMVTAYINTLRELGITFDLSRLSAEQRAMLDNYDNKTITLLC
jgi:hypothetical protein